MRLNIFHARGDFLQKLLPTGQRRLISGKVELFDGIAQMVARSAVRSVGSAVGREIARGVLGSLLGGGSRRR